MAKSYRGPLIMPRRVVADVVTGAEHTWQCTNSDGRRRSPGRRRATHCGNNDAVVTVGVQVLKYHFRLTTAHLYLQTGAA